jgi:hypothetical protein
MLFIFIFFRKMTSWFQRHLLRPGFIFGLLFLSHSSVSAFDTFWHSSAATIVGNKFGFSADATRVLQFSSFCMDYFGPFITEVVGALEKSAGYLELRNLPTTGQTHAASNLMHFDNLAGAIDRNWKIDYLWSRLLDNTRRKIVRDFQNAKLKDDTRKKIILLSLGASLHMVEDFYSHSDWIHFNFASLGFKRQKNDKGYDRAPTWFEVRKKFGAPSARQQKENWKMKVCCGVFPPADSVPKSSFGVPLSHTPMNHDNSQLYYAGESQIKYHKFGLFPATDSASAVRHQLYAYHTACAAAIEWIELLEEDPVVKTAIDYAKGWDMKGVDADVVDDLEDGLYSALMISCILQKWDGNYPPPERDKDCGTLKILEHIHIPKMSNKFWGSFPKDTILQYLSFGFGDSTGHYTFDSLWVGKHPMKRD